MTLALVAAAAMALGACDEDPAALQPDQAAEAIEPGVHAVLTAPLAFGESAAVQPGRREAVLRPEGETLSLEMHLVRVQVENEISSYQAQLRYDTDLLEFAGGTVPQGIVGTFNEPEPGRIRMVGVALDGMPEAEAFTMEFRIKSPSGDTELLLEMEEVTGDVGEVDLTSKSIARRLHLLWDANQDAVGDGKEVAGEEERLGGAR